MNNEEHTARKQNERIKDKEIARLRQQIAEFTQERGNFTRTIFELRGIIEEAERRPMRSAVCAITRISKRIGLRS
jgi:hypothetical protein